MSEHLFLYRIKDSDDRDCCAYIDAAGPKLNAITISVQLMYVAAAILAVNFLYTKKLKRSLQKMNMKRFLHLTYLSKHLGMESRKVIVDTERESNLLILLNISMIN